MLVLAGPETDLLPPRSRPLRAYVAAGGKVLVMSEPPLKAATPNLDGLLAELEPGGGQGRGGRHVRHGPALRLRRADADRRRVPVPRHHARTSGVTTAFHGARSLQAGAASLPGVTAQNLVLTSEASWAETDLQPRTAPSSSTAKDKRGPISLGAVATIQVDHAGASRAGAPPVAVARRLAGAAAAQPARGGWWRSATPTSRATRCSVFQGNRDFFLNVVAWLAEDADLISIRPREPEDQRMFLAAGQQQVVAAVALLLLPGLFVVLGIGTLVAAAVKKPPFLADLRRGGRLRRPRRVHLLRRSKRGARPGRASKEKVFALDKDEGRGA